MTLAFDLEQDIIRCWNVTTDLSEILDDLESGKMKTEDAITALRAYQTVYEHRFNKCWERFEVYNQEAWSWKQRAQEYAQDLVESKNPTDSKGKMGRSKGQKEVDQ